MSCSVWYLLHEIKLEMTDFYPNSTTLCKEVFYFFFFLISSIGSNADESATLNFSGDQRTMNPDRRFASWSTKIQVLNQLQPPLP